MRELLSAAKPNELAGVKKANFTEAIRGAIVLLNPYSLREPNRDLERYYQSFGKRLKASTTSA